MPTLRLFASLREIAGTGSDDFSSKTLGDLFADAGSRYGTRFIEALSHASVVVNGERVTADPTLSLADKDEVALLPPVSGGRKSASL